ncbi:NADPH:quinone reductase [Pseudonocardia sp. KRD291]|uniref:NADPH:quinone reductase n=1 Tax=Pseudonocardia sp. KRD291 TaxID=2792007 RepID=UPI001C4A15D8|nr:NADPH:quinone reductase [Pseudonocardia sp. KRD291]MBW0105375.1 NADPH:quinone reductase [Pseudonocardia sp. KRD291]
MRAAIYRTTGPAPDVLELVELDVPDPRAGEVRVAISASGVNPTDWKARAGLTGRVPDDFQVPHHDGAGRVDAIGPGVTGLAVGQRVWLYLAAADNLYGTAAEFAVVPASKVVPLPDNASDELGACLGVPALTAAYCLGGDPGAVRGRTVLVAGGAGAVGHFAIELAKHAGAHVVTTVSSEAKGDLARAAGADLVLNYREEDVAERILASVGHVDRVVEVALGTNIDIDAAVIGPNATIAVYAGESEQPRIPILPLAVVNASIQFALMYTVSAAEFERVTAWTNSAIEADALSALPVSEYELDDVVAAQVAVEKGAIGKVLVRP